MTAINRQRRRLLTRLKLQRLINEMRAHVTRELIDMPIHNIRWQKPGETIYEDEYIVLTLDKVYNNGVMQVTGKYKPRAALAFVRFEDIER